MDVNYLVHFAYFVYSKVFMLLQVDYKFNTSTGALEILNPRENFVSNISILLQWSPYSTEAELLKQVSSYGIFCSAVNLLFNQHVILLFCHE